MRTLQADPAGRFWMPGSPLDAGFRLCLPGSAPPDAGHAYEMHRIILLKRLFRCFSLKLVSHSNFLKGFLDVAP